MCLAASLHTGVQPPANDPEGLLRCAAMERRRPLTKEIRLLGSTANHDKERGEAGQRGQRLSVSSTRIGEERALRDRRLHIR